MKKKKKKKGTFPHFLTFPLSILNFSASLFQFSSFLPHFPCLSFPDTRSAKISRLEVSGHSALALMTIRSRLLATESLSYNNNNVQGLYPGDTCIWRWISSSVRRPYGRFEIMTRRCSHVHHFDVQNNCCSTVRRGNLCWGSFPVARRREVLAWGGGARSYKFLLFLYLFVQFGDHFEAKFMPFVVIFVSKQCVIYLI